MLIRSKTTLSISRFAGFLVTGLVLRRRFRVFMTAVSIRFDSIDRVLKNCLTTRTFTFGFYVYKTAYLPRYQGVESGMRDGSFR